MEVVWPQIHYKRHSLVNMKRVRIDKSELQLLCGQITARENWRNEGRSSLLLWGSAKHGQVDPSMFTLKNVCWKKLHWFSDPLICPMSLQIKMSRLIKLSAFYEVHAFLYYVALVSSASHTSKDNYLSCLTRLINVIWHPPTYAYIRIHMFAFNTSKNVKLLQKSANTEEFHIWENKIFCYPQSWHNFSQKIILSFRDSDCRRDTDMKKVQRRYKKIDTVLFTYLKTHK